MQYEHDIKHSPDRVSRVYKNGLITWTMVGLNIITGGYIITQGLIFFITHIKI